MGINRAPGRLAFYTKSQMCSPMFDRVRGSIDYLLHYVALYHPIQMISRGRNYITLRCCGRECHCRDIRSQRVILRRESQGGHCPESSLRSPRGWRVWQSQRASVSRGRFVTRSRARWRRIQIPAGRASGQVRNLSSLASQCQLLEVIEDRLYLRRRSNAESSI